MSWRGASGMMRDPCEAADTDAARSPSTARVSRETRPGSGTSGGSVSRGTPVAVLCDRTQMSSGSSSERSAEAGGQARPTAVTVGAAPSHPPSAEATGVVRWAPGTPTAGETGAPHGCRAAGTPRRTCRRSSNIGAWPVGPTVAALPGTRSYVRRSQRMHPATRGPRRPRTPSRAATPDPSQHPPPFVVPTGRPAPGASGPERRRPPAPSPYLRARPSWAMGASSFTPRARTGGSRGPHGRGDARFADRPGHASTKPARHDRVQTARRCPAVNDAE